VNQGLVVSTDKGVRGRRKGVLKKKKESVLPIQTCSGEDFQGKGPSGRKSRRGFIRRGVVRGLVEVDS